MKTLKICINLVVLFLLQYFHQLYINTESSVNYAIAPLAIMGASAAIQGGLGLYQKHKADKMKVDDSAEKAAIGNMVNNQKELIKRSKVRETSGMPGQERTEAKIGASTANAVEQYKQLGNQAGYQDFLNQALQIENQKLADLGSESAQYSLNRSKDVDSAISGMSNIYGSQFRRGAEQTDQQKADIAAAKGTAGSNIAGAFRTGASGAMMMAGGGAGAGNTAPLPYA